MKKVAFGEIEIELGKILDQYANDVKDAVAVAVRKTGNLARNKLKETSPKRTGEYAKGWTASEYLVDQFGASIKVHNKTRYMLTHLLEKGHANRNGGRTPARVHIAPVEEEASRNLEKITKGLIQDI